MEAKPLIVIVGPTASGKTALGITIAKKYDGEIICADSRTVYKEMDIGTAKPTKEEQLQVRHHLIDVVAPDEEFSLADFQKLARKVIADVRSRGKLPIMVGGSGLYVDSIIFDYQLDHPVDVTMRKHLDGMTLEQLYEYCKKNNIELPENYKNKRYVIRAIEQGGVNKQRRNEPIEDCLVVGISTEKDELARRIEERANTLFQQGMLEEALEIGNKYKWKDEAFTGNIYRIAHDIQKGSIAHDDAIEAFILSDRRLAKKQLTWFKRNKYIHWGSPEELKELIQDYLEKRKNDKIEHDSYTSVR